MRIERIASWALSFVLAAALALMVGLPELIGLNPNSILAIMATRSGVALFEAYVRYGVGLGEIAAALLLLWPASRRAGSLLAFAIIAGAIGVHLSVWLGIAVPYMAKLTVALAQGRSVAAIAPMHLPSHGGALFETALGPLGVAAAIYWLERRKRASAIDRRAPLCA